MYGIQDAIDFSKINKILVIKLRHHGDVLLASPVFQVIKNHHPHIQTDALVYEDTQEMLTLHPAIHQTHTIDRGWKKLGIKKQFDAEYTLLKKLKSEKYDLIIHLTEHWRGALIKRFTGAKYAVSAKYTRRSGRFWKNSFTHHYPKPKKSRHIVDKHLDALRRIGITPSQLERGLTLIPGNDAEENRNKILDDNDIDNYILIHPTSRWLFKCWETTKFSVLINELSKKDLTIVITAAPNKNELKVVREIIDNCGAAVLDLSGKLSLKELAAFIDKAKLFVGVDSVPMHMADAFKTPCVALFGPSDDQEWGPRNSDSTIINSNHPCRPCAMNGCAGSNICDCLNSITVEEVLSACKRHLDDQNL